MKAIFFKRFGYWVSIAALLALTSLFPGQTSLGGTFDEKALAASDPVIAAAGDIACDPTNSGFNGGNGVSNSCRQKYTSDLLVNAGLAAVLPLGDNQYYCGGYQAFLQAYDPSWGRVKSITRPVVGNHEYLTSGGTDCNSANSGAAGYFNYFGSAAGNRGQGYYSYNIGTWHLIALNSNCSDAGGCSSSSPQGQWLAADLAAHTNFCTLAYWHIPLFSSGGRDSSNMRSIWQTLYDNNVDLVLSGHDHIYERFAPQTATGTLDTARGMREFIVGSGGANHTSLATIFPNSEIRNVDTFGILKLTLHPTSYDWQFVPEAGKMFTDTGTGACHGTTPDTLPPTAPSNLTASAPATNQVNLSWSAGTDNIAVVGYQIFRNGTQIATAPTLSYTDTTTLPQTTYTYSVKSVDGSGLTSGFSNTATLTTPLSPTNLTFLPAADADIQSGTPTTNYGADTILQTDNSPVKSFLLKFSISGLTGQHITSARLRLFNVDASGKGGDFYRVNDNSWQENTVTWNNAPAPDTTLLASLGAVQVNTWYEIDLTSLITAAGTYSLRVSSTSSDGADFSSKEGPNPPQLVVVAQSGPTSTPTRTSTVTLTNTATPSATATATRTSTATSTSTFTATSTSTRTATSTSTSTFTFTVTAQPSPTFTRTLTPTFTATQMVQPSATFTNTATFTLTPTVFADPSLTPSNTPTLEGASTSTETLTPTVSVLETDTASPTLDPAITPSETPTVTSVPTAQGTDTATPEPSPSAAPTFTATETAIPIMTNTTVPTNSPTSTATASRTPTPTRTASTTPLPPPTSTPTASFTPPPLPTQTRTSTPTSTPAPASFTFLPAADSYVNEGSPATNYGAATQFRVDGSPIVRTYIRFNVQGLNGTIRRVTLRVFANSSSSSGYSVGSVSNNTWTETTINYNNAPPVGGAVGSSNGFSGGVWTTVDITSLVTGNGTLNLALTTSSSTAISLASRESGANAPQLIVETVH
jgi:hypothetical protein